MTVKRTRAKKVSNDSDDYTPKTADVAPAKEPAEESAPKRYRLRSGAAGRIEANKENPSNNDNVSKTKQEAKPKVTKPKSGPKPFIEYKGKVEYYTQFGDIQEACEKLLKWVQSEAERPDCTVIPIAFDMEWPFTFQTGAGRSAVIQLCADVNLCYVLHISKLKVLPPALLELLYHEKVCLHGVCVKNDLRKLQRDYPAVDSQRMVDQCKDLGVWCNEVCNTGGRWSMERLVMYLCKLQINKEGKVRRSKWDVQPLTPEQQIYAAIDVYIAQVMYIELEQRLQKKLKEEAEIVDEFGEKALAAIKQLQ